MRCVEGQANSYVKRERLRPCVDLMSERVRAKQTKRQPVAFVGEPCEIVVKAGVDLLIGVSEHEKKSNCVLSAYTTLVLHTQDSKHPRPKGSSWYRQLQPVINASRTQFRMMPVVIERLGDSRTPI